MATLPLTIQDEHVEAALTYIPIAIEAEEGLTNAEKIELIRQTLYLQLRSWYRRGVAMVEEQNSQAANDEAQINAEEAFTD